MKTVSRLVLAHLAAVTCAFGCSAAPADTLARSGTAPSRLTATHTIFVHGARCRSGTNAYGTIIVTGVDGAGPL